MDVQNAIVPNHRNRLFLIVAYMQEDGALFHETFPIVAWEIEIHQTDRGSVRYVEPIAFGADDELRSVVGKCVQDTETDVLIDCIYGTSYAKLADWLADVTAERAKRRNVAATATPPAPTDKPPTP